MRCALYTRVSTELDVQKTSIENQEDMFRNYTAQRNWEIVKIYTDKKSGTKEKRPGLQKMIEDGKAGVYDVILAKELSRLARNGRLSYELRDLCLMNNIDIVCLDNSINSVEGNTQNFGLFAWLYENESANSSRRNKQAKKVKAQRGFFIGSHPPFGYRLENGVLKIKDDNTPNIVRRIFQEYLNGTGMETIAKKLTEEKVPTPAQCANKSNASNLWHASSIKLILSNQHYCGNLVQYRTETISVTSSKRREVNKENQIVIENTHEAIIPRETFNTVQDMRQSRTKIVTAPKKHLFTNIVYCEECQRGMWYQGAQKAYRCGGNLRHGNTFCTNKNVIRENELINVILEDLKPLFNTLNKENYLKSIMNKLNKNKEHILSEIEKIERKLGDLKNKKLDYVNLFTDDVITREELTEFRNMTDQKMKDLQIKKDQLNTKMEECESENYVLHISKLLKDVLNLKELSPEVLHTLVEKITCTDGNIRIHYKFVNPLQIA